MIEENEPSMEDLMLKSMDILVNTVPAGGGKTASFVREVSQSDEMYIYVAKRHDLINEVYDRLVEMQVDPNEIIRVYKGSEDIGDGDYDFPTKVINKASTYDKRVILTTTETFKAANTDVVEERYLFFDEMPAFFDFYSFATKDMNTAARDNLVNIENIPTSKVLKKVMRTSNDVPDEDKDSLTYKNVLKGFLKWMAKNNEDVYFNNKNLVRLSFPTALFKRAKQVKILSATPYGGLFAHFLSYTGLRACTVFEPSVHESESDDGINKTFVEAMRLSSLDRCIDAGRLTLEIWIIRKNPVNKDKENKHLSKAFLENKVNIEALGRRLKRVFPDKLKNDDLLICLNSDEEKYQNPLLEQAGMIRLKNRVRVPPLEGLNTLANCTTVIYLSALRLPPDHVTIVRQLLRANRRPQPRKFDDDEGPSIDSHMDNMYQTVMRTALRTVRIDQENTTEVRIYVWSRVEAEGLAKMLAPSHAEDIVHQTTKKAS